MRPSELRAQLARESAGRPAVEWASSDEDEEEEEGSDVDSMDSDGQDDATSLAQRQEESGMHPVMEQTLDLFIWGMPFGACLTHPCC
jgi:hypothetical protein